MVKRTVNKFIGFQKRLNLFILRYKPNSLYYSDGKPSYSPYKGGGGGTCYIIRERLICRSYMGVSNTNCIRPLTISLSYKKSFSTITFYNQSGKLAPLDLSVSKVNSKKEFWKILKSFDKVSPIQIVDNFFKNYYSPSQIAKKNISLDLIQCILKPIITDFKLTSTEFNILRGIEPCKYELPIKLPLTQLFGKHRGGNSSLLEAKPGVYKFTNKVNGYTYVGSSLTLASRLSEYFRYNLKNRDVELAIKEYGLANFELEVWFLPLEFLANEQLKYLTLGLEQMLILEFNPQYNNIKVVGGSVAGLVRKLESLQPSILKNLIPRTSLRGIRVTYFYDYLNKELLYIAQSRNELTQILNMNSNYLSKYIDSNNLYYLGRFFISDELLTSCGYTENLFNGKNSDLFDLVNSHKLVWKSEISSFKRSKSSGAEGLKKAIKLINIKTEEELVFDSIADTSKYIQSYDPKYKASTGTLSYTVNKGAIHKGTFKMIKVERNKRTFSTLLIRNKVDHPLVCSVRSSVSNLFHLRSLLLDLALHLFIALLIGSLEILKLDTHYIVMIIALIFLIIINFEFFFKKQEYKYRREITNIKKLFFNTSLNNLTRKNCIFPWVISSVIIIIIITIISCIFYIFRTRLGEINWEYFFVYLNDQPYLYIIIIVVVIQVVLIRILLSKLHLNEMIYFLGYILTLRFAFLLLLNIIFAFGIEEITLSLSIYEILNRSKVLCNIFAWLEPKVLFWLQSLDRGLIVKRYINKLANLFIEKYKPLYFNRIILFQYRLFSEPSYSKVSLVKPKLLGSGYYRSLFQPCTLPQVYSCPPFNAEFTLNDLSLFILYCKTYVCNWDDKTWVGSNYDSETVVGSEYSLDYNLCKDGELAPAVKKRDPQLNFSDEYINNNRIQSVFVNKGKERATSLDLISDNGENSHNPAIEYIDLNQLANLLDGDLNRAINESRQTNEYNLRAGESSTRGGQGLYGQGNTTTSLTGLAPAQPYGGDENMLDKQVDLADNEFIANRQGSELPEVEATNYPIEGIDGSFIDLENRRGDLGISAQLVEQFVQVQSDSEDNISLPSHNSENFIDIWDSDFTIKEFKSFFYSVANEELFSNELYKEFLEDFHSLEEISSIVINENLEKSSYDGMLHLSLEGLVSMSKNEISNLIKELRTNKFINTTSYVENKVKKTFKGNYYLYTRIKLNSAKGAFKRSLRSKKFADLSNIQKEELTSKFKAEHEKLKDELNENKDSPEFLMDLSVTIEGLVRKFLNAPTRIIWEDRAIHKRVESLQKFSSNIKFRVNKLINRSNLENKIKDILLKQVEEIFTNLHAGLNIGNEIDLAYLDELENKIKDTSGRLVKRSHLICNDTLKVIADHQFKSGNFYPTTKNSLLIAELHKCIRDDIIHIVSNRLYARVRVAERWGLIEDRKLAMQELYGELNFLKKALYIIPNIQDACQHLIEVLVKLNNKHYYPCSMKSSYNKFNYFIYTKLKEIIIRFIEKFKYNN